MCFYSGQYGFIHFILTFTELSQNNFQIITKMLILKLYQINKMEQQLVYVILNTNPYFIGVYIDYQSNNLKNMFYIIL